MNRLCAVLILFCALVRTALPTACAITIDTVPVGNPDNPGDPAIDRVGTSGHGSVDHGYRIGKSEVTNAEYAAFLNAKAASDPLALYNVDMGSGYGGIARSGVPGAYTYTPISDRENMPVNYVNWYDAIRFANWLHNGQGSGDTETGSYTLGALDANGVPIGGGSITRNPGATWVLPTDDEWYKAAYHKNDGLTDHYFKYPTSSDLTPTSEAPPGGSNSVNFGGLGDVTRVGAYTGTTSPYGAFDLGGNVWEWNETLTTSPFRRARGGAFDGTVGLLSTDFDVNNPVLQIYTFGFRVANVPEPSTSVLAIVGCGILWALRKRPRADNEVLKPT